MENYSLLMGAAAVMKMAVEMAAVSMEKPSGALPAPRREINHIATGTAPSLDGELLLLMGAAVMKMAEMAAVSMEKPSGHFPAPAGCRNRDSCPPDLGFAMAAALEDKTLLDTTCSGSFTSNKEEFKRDLLDRIKENAEDWENNKGYADKPPFKPLPPKEGSKEREEEKKKKKGTKKKKKKKKKENKKKEVTAYPRVNEITLGNRKYVAPNDYCDNESEYDDLPMPFIYISDHDLNEHTTFDITNLWETNSENDNNCHSVSAIHASSHNDIESSKLGEEVFENPFATGHYVLDTSPSNNNDGLLERDIFDLFLPEFDKPWVLPDFIAEWMELQNTGPPDLSRTWTMNFDGSKRLEGAGAGVILVSPEGDKLKYVLRMTFPNASNNEAEYEALIHGMKMAKACGATRLKIFGDSQLVAQQVMNQCDAVNESMIAYKEVYNELEKLFDGCEVNHISRMSNDEADVLANIGSQCLAIPPGVFWEEISERSTKPAKTKKEKKEKPRVSPKTQQKKKSKS
ncbi:hypothetical protein QYE76_057820 [Lolium multiflorum]|uniref:RNase H type-1 domain-containing protein n=1 Tax=Lolium multiflorum TaxID=4521 RepID=A0AAD8T485_LOLMU|nr:hypothetical protein QYE76_057820 [Lolium multiflorum]